MANEYLLIRKPFAADFVEVFNVTGGGNTQVTPIQPGQWKIRVPLSGATGAAFLPLLVKVGRDPNPVANRRHGRIDLHLLGDGDLPVESNRVLIVSTRADDTDTTPPISTDRPSFFRTTLAVARPWSLVGGNEAPNPTGNRTVRSSKSIVGNAAVVSGVVYTRGLLEIAFQVG